MSLLRWETVFFLGDEVYHMSRAASDLGVLLDACFYGIPSMAAMVRVMSSLFLFVFHTLFLGPRSSLASDAAIFFGDMQFHFFHMLLCTWQLVHYLWTAQKRQARTDAYYWTCFIFHTGIVWFYTSGITVSVRVQLAHAPGNNAPAAVPPPIPAAPDPDAVAMAIAAARAADAAAARLAAHRRSSALSPRSSPRFGSPRRGSSHSSSRRDSTLGQGTPVGNFSEPRRLPEERSARGVFGSVTQTLSGSSVSTPSTTALVPYVERQMTPRNNSLGQLELHGDAQQRRAPDVSSASVGSPAAHVLTPVSSEPAANKARADSIPDKPEIPAKDGVEDRVRNSVLGPSADVVRGSVEGASAGLATAGGRLQSPTTEEDFDSAPRASTKGSAATFTYGSSEMVLDLDESSVKCPSVVKKVGKSPAEPQDPSLPGPSCSRAQDAVEKPSESPRELSAKQSLAMSRKNSSPGSPFQSPMAAQGASSPGSPPDNAPDARASRRSPGESPSKKQSPTASRKSSVSDNPTSKPTTTDPGSFPGSPSGGLQDPKEKIL